MVGVTIEQLVRSAPEQWNRYTEDTNVLDGDLAKQYGVTSNQLHEQLTGFLQGRNIPFPPGLDPSLDQPGQGIAVAGEAAHFVRKLTARNYETTNPLPLVEVTFEALELADNLHAALFLNKLCELMTWDGNGTSGRKSSPRCINEAIESILPHLIHEAQERVNEAKDAHSRNTHKLAAALCSIKDGYHATVDQLLQYLAGVIHTNNTDGHSTLPTLDGFYTSIDKAVQPVTRTARKFGLNLDTLVTIVRYHPVHADAISHFEQEYGSLLSIKADVAQDTLRARVALYVQQSDEQGYAACSLRIDRGRSDLRPVYDLLIAMCQYLRGKKGLPQDYAAMTTLAEKTVRLNFYERNPFHR